MRKSKLEKGDLTLKDMSVTSENDSTKQQHDNTRYQLRDYSLKHHVVMERSLNDDADKDLIFRLIVDDYEVLLDAEQLMRHLRWV